MKLHPHSPPYVFTVSCTNSLCCEPLSFENVDLNVFRTTKHKGNHFMTMQCNMCSNLALQQCICMNIQDVLNNTQHLETRATMDFLQTRAPVNRHLWCKMAHACLQRMSSWSSCSMSSVAVSCRTDLDLGGPGHVHRT